MQTIKNPYFAICGCTYSIEDKTYMFYISPDKEKTLKYIEEFESFNVQIFGSYLNEANINENFLCIFIEEDLSIQEIFHVLLKESGWDLITYPNPYIAGANIIEILSVIALMGLKF